MKADSILMRDITKSNEIAEQLVEVRTLFMGTVRTYEQLLSEKIARIKVLEDKYEPKAEVQAELPPTSEPMKNS